MDASASAAPAPLRRSLALGMGALLGMGLLLGTRGTESAWGLVLRIEPDSAVRDVLGFLLAAVGIGLVVPLIAGNYISGLPARAQCIVWAGVAVAVQPASGEAQAMSPQVWSTVALGELLVLAGCVWITTTACWLVDTRITFPRLYPNPDDRPPSKHTTPRDVVAVHLPNAVGLALGVGILYRVVPGGTDPIIKPLVIAFGAAFLSHVLQRARPSRGSIWAMMGVIGGVALGTIPFGGADAGPWDDRSAAVTPLLTCAVTGYSVVLLRTRVRLADLVAADAARQDDPPT